MEVMNGHKVRCHLVAQFIRLAIGHAAFDACSGNPHCEAVGVMITAVPFGPGVWCASELGCPNQQRFVEQAALLQILHQSGHSLIRDEGVLFVLFFQVGVLIPRAIHAK